MASSDFLRRVGDRWPSSWDCVIFVNKQINQETKKVETMYSVLVYRFGMCLLDICLEKRRAAQSTTFSNVVADRIVCLAEPCYDRLVVWVGCLGRAGARAYSH